MKRNAGFTMIEVIVIVAVIAILAGILTPLVIKEIGKSKLSRGVSDMEAVSTAFSQYYIDTGVWPENYTGAKDLTASFQKFDCFFSNTKKVSGWDGPYMKRSVLDKKGKRLVAAKVGSDWEGVIDPWGSPFQIMYAKPGSKNGGPGGGIAVVSAGPNGKFDTKAKSALAGVATSDDLVHVVTTRIL